MDLEYKIGEMDIDIDKLNFNGHDPYKANHLFVVTHEKNTAVIHIAQVDPRVEDGRHRKVVDKYNLELHEIVGGGSLYEKDGILYLGDYSGNYGAIAKEAAEEFLKMIVHLLVEKGAEFQEVKSDPRKGQLNKFWHEK